MLLGEYCWRQSVSSLLFIYETVIENKAITVMSYIIDQCRILFCKKPLLVMSDVAVLSLLVVNT